MKNKAVSVPPGEDNWQAESDADTLIKAQQIKADPKRLKAAKAILMEKKHHTNKAAADVGVKDEGVSDDMDMEGMED
jgi:hypothetical protein